MKAEGSIVDALSATTKLEKDVDAIVERAKEINVDIEAKSQTKIESKERNHIVNQQIRDLQKVS